MEILGDGNGEKSQAFQMCRIIILFKQVHIAQIEIKIIFKGKEKKFPQMHFFKFLKMAIVFPSSRQTFLVFSAVFHMTSFQDILS